MIPLQRIQTNKNRLTAEKRNIQEHLSGTDKCADDWRSLVERTFEFANHAKGWFKQGDLREKNDILLAIGTDFLLKDKQIHIEWRLPFQILRDNHDGIWQYHHERLELLKSRTKKAENGHFDAFGSPTDKLGLELFNSSDLASDSAIIDSHLDASCFWRGNQFNFRTPG